jgi:RNA polymerase sigma-70 factor (ECF subfamily)
MRDDRELLEAWQGGDKNAGEHLLERHFDSLFRFFRGRVDGDVPELVQRTLTACVEKRDRFPDGVSVKAYLLGIARNELLMYLRKRERGRRALDRVAAAPVWAESPSHVVAAREEERLVLWALRRLPLEVQLLLELSYWEDLSIAEIASVLEVPHGTVKSRLHRARALLRAEIEAAPHPRDLVTTTLRELETWARDLRDRVGSS